MMVRRHGGWPWLFSCWIWCLSVIDQLARWHFDEASSPIEWAIPRLVSISREMECLEARVALELHQGEAYWPAERRDRNPLPAVAASELQRSNAGRRHVDDAAQADPGMAQVGFVFDLRQQRDFIGTTRATHGSGLGTLCRGREEEA